MKSKLWIDSDIVVSPAWLKLSKNAKSILGIFWRKRRMVKVKISGKRKKAVWVEANNGEIQFTYSEAQKIYNINRQTFCNALDELVSTGFLDIVRPGVGFARCSTLFKLSIRWRDYGNENFKNLKRPKRVAHRPVGFKNKFSKSKNLDL